MSLERPAIQPTEETFSRLFKITQIQMQYPKWVEITALRIINETIVDKIHERMASLGYSKKIIDTTYVDRLVVGTHGEIVFDIISDYKSEKSFDVARAREEGTFAVFVKPVIRKALSWIDRGVRYFSRGHLRLGITRSSVVKDTTDEFLPVAQEKLDRETDEFTEKIMRGQ